MQLLPSQTFRPQWHPILQTICEQFRPISLTWSPSNGHTCHTLPVLILPIVTLTPTITISYFMIIRILVIVVSYHPISYIFFVVFKCVHYFHIFIGWRWLQYCSWKLSNTLFISCQSQLLHSPFWVGRIFNNSVHTILYPVHLSVHCALYLLDVSCTIYIIHLHRYLCNHYTQCVAEVITFTFYKFLVYSWKFLHLL